MNAVYNVCVNGYATMYVATLQEHHSCFNQIWSPQ